MRKFVRCNHCGNLVGFLDDSGVPIICCGEPMAELVPNTTDGAQEKHVPEVKIDGKDLIINIGSADHPMEEKHYIEWIFVETEDGGELVRLKPGDLPHAIVSLGDRKAVAVYEYCNIHGLWKKDL